VSDLARRRTRVAAVAREAGTGFRVPLLHYVCGTADPAGGTKSASINSSYVAHTYVVEATLRRGHACMLAQVSKYHVTQITERLQAQTRKLFVV